MTRNYTRSKRVVLETSIFLPHLGEKGEYRLIGRDLPRSLPQRSRTDANYYLYASKTREGVDPNAMLVKLLNKGE